MRTTVTLDPDVARLLDERARQTRKSFKETLNAAVRASLGSVATSPESRQFHLDARPMRLKAGIDAGSLNSLLDDLDAGNYLDNNRQRRRKTMSR